MVATVQLVGEFVSSEGGIIDFWDVWSLDVWGADGDRERCMKTRVFFWPSWLSTHESQSGLRV